MLAPVSVHADYFHKNIDVTMLTLGIRKVRELGFKGITVEGDYHFYNRVGFRTSSEYKIYPTSGPTSIGQLIEILDFYGVKHAERNTRISKKNPAPYKYSILTVHTNKGYSHWILWFDNKYYDPEFGLIEGEYTHGKITSFLGIYE